MSIFLAEVIGTALLIILGNGVVANVVLSGTKGHNSGWIVITFGWAIAVFVGVYSAAAVSGAHLNPAISLAMVLLKRMNVAILHHYILGQLIGAALGQICVWLAYRSHYNTTVDSSSILATFATMPAIFHPFNNFVSELIGTFVLVMGVLFIASPTASLGALDALPVALLVLGIGLSLGGSTGYAINPARDFIPRLLHSLLPIRHKGGSGWHYAWIPVFAPLLGSIAATIVYQYLYSTL